MPEKKKIKDHQTSNNFTKRVGRLVKDLYYISETDAEILPFIGEKAESVTKEILLRQTGKAFDSSVEERSFEEFFSRLTEFQDWFGEEEKQIAERFLALKEFLHKELKDLKVFKVGNIELDVYVVGVDSDDFLAGVTTKAVET